MIDNVRANVVSVVVRLELVSLNGILVDNLLGKSLLRIPKIRYFVGVAVH